MKRLVFIHHFKWNLIILLIVAWWSKGRIWGFQPDNRHICRGRKCSLPKRIKSAAALSLPKRERKVRAETWAWERIVSMVRIRAFTRFAGTLTIFFFFFFFFEFEVCILCEREERSRLWIRSLISQSSRYRKRDTARRRKCAAITFINFVKIHGLRDTPKGKAMNWKTWCIFWISDVSEHEDMHPSDLWWQPSRWPLSTVLLTWLSQSWNAVCLYTDLVEKDLLLGITFLSILPLGIAGNKNRVLPTRILETVHRPPPRGRFGRRSCRNSYDFALSVGEGEDDFAPFFGDFRNLLSVLLAPVSRFFACLQQTLTVALMIANGDTPTTRCLQKHDIITLIGNYP